MICYRAVHLNVILLTNVPPIHSIFKNPEKQKTISYDTLWNITILLQLRSEPTPNVNMASGSMWGTHRLPPAEGEAPKPCTTRAVIAFILALSLGGLSHTTFLSPFLFTTLSNVCAAGWSKQHPTGGATQSSTALDRSFENSPECPQCRARRTRRDTDSWVPRVAPCQSMLERLNRRAREYLSAKCEFSKKVGGPIVETSQSHQNFLDMDCILSRLQSAP